MYEEPVQDGRSRFELWEKGKNVGSSITPSTFDKDYLEAICSDILSLLKRVKKPNILSIGCGNAFIEKRLADSGCNVLATDVSIQALKFAMAKGLKVKYLDATGKFDLNNHFDLILSDGVIGHLADKNASVGKFLAEAKKALKEDGVLFIANDSPTKKVPVQIHDGFKNIYWFSAKYLRDSLKRSGYKSVGSKYLRYFRPGYGIRKRVLVWGRK